MPIAHIHKCIMKSYSLNHRRTYKKGNFVSNNIKKYNCFDDYPTRYNNQKITYISNLTLFVCIMNLCHKHNQDYLKPDSPT